MTLVKNLNFLATKSWASILKLSFWPEKIQTWTLWYFLINFKLFRSYWKEDFLKSLKNVIPFNSQPEVESVAVFPGRELDPIQSLDELRQIEKIQDQKQTQPQTIYEPNTYVESRPAWETQPTTVEGIF